MMRLTAARRRTGFWAALLAAFALFCLTAAAQENAKPDQLKVTPKEAELAKKIQNEKDVAAKLKNAEKLLKDFPETAIRDQVARYVSDQLAGVRDAAQQSALIDGYLKIFTKPAEVDYVAPLRIELLTRAKNFDEAFKLGGEYLARNENDLRVSIYLVTEGTNLVRGGNAKFAAPTEEIIGRSIGIIEGGTKPATVTDADWTEAQNSWRWQFYQAMGFINSSRGRTAAALSNFEMVTRLNSKDVNSWAMIGFITNQTYQDLARRYGVASGAEQEALRKQAETTLDKVIELYARVVALTDGVPEQANLNTQIRGDLEAYYKYRHNNSTDGLKALIDKFKTK